MIGNKQHLLFLNGHSLVETMRTLRWNAAGSFQAPESILIGNALKSTAHWTYMVQTKTFLFPMWKLLCQLLFPNGNGNGPYEKLSFHNFASLANSLTAVSLLSGTRSLLNMAKLFRFELKDTWHNRLVCSWNLDESEIRNHRVENLILIKFLCY